MQWLTARTHRHHRTNPTSPAADTAPTPIAGQVEQNEQHSTECPVALPLRILHGHPPRWRRTVTQ